jgi:hypothetical protein
MISKRPWKLAPLAALFALGLLMFSGGLTPSAVHAVDDIDAPDTVSDGGTITVTITTEDDQGDLTITAAGGSDHEFDDVECTPSCSGDVDGEGSDEVIVDTAAIDNGGTNNDLEVVLSLTVDCDEGDTITITADDDGGPADVEVECVLVNVVIIKDAAGAEAADEFEFEITDGDCDVDEFTLAGDGDEIGLSCAFDTFTIEEVDSPTGWTLTSIDCTAASGASAEEDEDNASVEIDLSDATESVECTFTNDSGAGEPGDLTVSVAPNTVNCNSISFISIVVYDDDGSGVEDGTPITVSTSIGSLNQTSIQTTGGGGGATVIFTAPATSGGTATINATSGDASGSATIQVNNCAVATAVPSPVPTATGSGTVSPPSTGDAGLAAGGGAGWQTMAGALLMTASLLGGLVAVRRRA